ncbi:MAG: primosomal protein N' [Chitinophagaceae bacterium]|nr:primosomal protein N' [Chitinophagaceae bacterium]MCW5904478.1 primosomal protein N' [Chitinophagaceae bacterium]
MQKNEQENITLTTSSTNLFAEIIIPLALPETYTWQIPERFIEVAQIGIRVEVQLRNKKYAGIIATLFSEYPKEFKPKEILNVLDDEPLVHEKQLQFWRWIAQYYMCTEGEVMQAAVPANLKLSGESILIWNEDANVDSLALTDEEFIVAEALDVKKELRLSEVQQILEATHVYPVIKKLIDKKVCFIWEELKEKYKPRTETFISLHSNYHQEKELENLLNNWSKAPKQLALLLAYIHFVKTEGEVIQAELLKKANVSAAQLKGLIDKNILIAEKRSVDRIASLPKQVSIDFTLSAIQQQAFENLQKQLQTTNVCLLHGITASGKTLIYIQLIEQYILQGKQVLYMLPEIALTTQVIRRIQKHFGGYIAIYHSKFNSNERVEIWNKVKTGDIKVVLGARSSLLLPFADLGLIIVDEEHDTSYKQQEPTPRYHARDAAIYYASLFNNAKVVLGSATPSVETYYNTQTKKYGLVELNERYGNVAMPSIELIDLKKVIVAEQVQQEKNTTPQKIILSPQLLNEIAISLKNKKQIILFQNRRGYSPYMICKTCGWIPQCNHCNVTLTYHKSANKLTCHYCATTYPAINTCAACGSHHFVQKNFGTEKIEEVLAEHFTDAKIARMDYDSIKGKNAHDNLIKLFEQHKIDILVGTQMVVKGLDFEHVNLVGIVDADGILNFTDFRVNERAFQLMEQVSGRAGRKDGVGKVLIQVNNMYHPVLNFIQLHDYKKLYNYELEGRKAYHYPPFFRLITLTFKHKEKHFAEQAAHIMMHGLQTHYQPYLQGPSQPVIDRIRNLYLWEILIKLPKDVSFIHQCKIAIFQQIAIIHNTKNLRGVMIVPDVDPI